MSGKQSTVGTQTTNYAYQYDKAGRLTNETINSVPTAYTYDAWGNRASMTGNGTSSTYTYDANNRLTKSITEEGSTTTTADYYYDHNGNQITKAVSVTTPQSGIAAYFMSPDTNSYLSIYQYDSYNRLKSADTDGTITSYTYDGNNLRQSKTSNGVTTQHIWDGSDMVMDGTNKFYRGATGIEFAVLNGNTSFYHKDAHGDVTALTDSAGTITQSYIYDAFGNQLNENENDNNPFRYCGEYIDNETGLTYLRNRYYDNAIGRFITEDPIKDGLNWYAYCGNNPVMFVDSLGLLREPDYNKYGQWSENPDKDDFGEDSAKYKMLVSLTTIGNNVDEKTSLEVAKIEEKLRNANVDNINRIMLLNNSSGAGDMGHVAVLLINKDDVGFLFSYYATVGDLSTILGVPGEMRFNVLSSSEWNSLLYDGSSSVLLSSEGYLPEESFDRNLYLTVNSNSGLNSFERGVNIFVDPGTYYLLGKNCDDVAQNIVVAGGKGYFRAAAPNLSFTLTRLIHTGK